MKQIDIIEADTPTISGRTYSADMLRAMVDAIQEDIKARRVLLYTHGGDPGLKDAIAVVTKLEFDGKFMQVDWEAMDRPMAKLLDVLDTICPAMSGVITDELKVTHAKIQFFYLASPN